MFTPREQMAGFGTGAGLRTRAVAMPVAPAPPSRAAQLFLVLADRWAAMCAPVGRWVAARDLAPDLAEDIGSKRWFRGFGTMLSLSLGACAFWPSFAPLEAASLVPLDEASRVELRVQGIRPLAQGADSGRHMIATDAVIPLAAAPERPTLDLSATLGAGDSFARMLQRAGVGAGDAGRVADLVAAQVPLSSLTPGTRFAITLGTRSSPYEPRPLDALSFRARFDLGLDVRRQGGGLALATRPIAVDTTPLRIRGIVGASLYRSARAAGTPPGTVQDYLRAIDQHMAFEEIAPGDEFDLVFANKRTATGEAQAGDLLYAGVLRDGKPRLQLMRWGSDGDFYSPQGMAEGSQADSGLLGAPVNGHITSGYGARRHPILGFVRMHAGIDFGASWGSPVYAVTDGTVSYAGWHGGHGNYVRLDHGGGIGTGYGHMSRIAVGSGMHVRRGQVIGYVGSTGLSTGPHLHYELYRNGQTVNPLSIGSIARRAEVDPAQLAAFRARLAQLTALRTGALHQTN